MDISLETIQDFCRACLKYLKRQKYNIQSLDLQIRNWLKDATVNNPLATDTYPNSICCSCRKKLKDFSEFRQMCDRSRKTFYDVLNNSNVKEEGVNSPTEDNTALSEKEFVAGESQEEHFLRIDMVESNSADCSIKREHMKDNLEIEEPLKQTDITNEENLAEMTFSTNLENNDDDEKEKYNSLNEELCHIENDDNSDSDSSNVPINGLNCSTFDGSSNEEDATKTNLKKTDKSATKKKKYTYTFRCDQCKYRAVSQQTLDIHKRTHLGLKPYQCSKCDQAFDKSNQMLKHLNEFHGEKKLTIVCEHLDCGKKFKSTRSYKEHYRQNHIMEETQVEKADKPAEKEPDKHVCEECGKVYTKSQAFKKHKYTHGPKELYPYQCTECGKAFIHPRSFKEHKQRHAGIRNFECSYCGAKKTTKKELWSHINSHTKEKKYPCPNCPLVFYRTTNLRVHVEVVHQGIRRFVCRFCDQTFGKGDNLKHHELLHTGEKPHECKECGKRFVQKVSLRLHMKTHNK